MTRRHLAAVAAGALAARALAKPKYRAVVIGHTGRGNYGHDWDTAWTGLPDVEVAAVADPDAEGRARAQKRSGAPRAYADYRKMLEVEKPNLAAICPRWLDQRVEMVAAAAAAGSHILMEKPFAASVEDADKMVAAVERARVKVQVGHSARSHPVTLQVRGLLREGALGKLLEVRARGKEDKRAGGEDLMVLGTHCFDMMRFLLGDPAWVFAHVAEGTREVERSSARNATEPVGPVAGDDVAAMFGFGGGITGYFGSKANDVASGPRFGITFYGSRGVLWMPLGNVPQDAAMILRAVNWAGAWQPVPPPPAAAFSSRHAANELMVRDLLDAIEKNREPVCGARDGRWAVEMVQGIYQSQISRSRVALPLADRSGPFASRSSG